MRISGDFYEKQARILERLSISLRNHIKELEAIEKKIKNGDVPEGKKERLRQRMHIIETKVLPKIRLYMNRCSC